MAVMFLIHAASIQSDALRPVPTTTTLSERLLLSANARQFRSVQLEIPLSSVRDGNGTLTANGESFFQLLARRMVSLQLSVKLTVHSPDVTPFAAAIAGRMMREAMLESAQVCICNNEHASDKNDPKDDSLTITITLLRSSAGDVE